MLFTVTVTYLKKIWKIEKKMVTSKDKQDKINNKFNKKKDNMF